MRVHAAGRTPFAALLRRLGRLSSRRAGIALVYHAIGEVAGDPDFEINPPLPAHVLEQQLRHLRRHYRVVPAAEIHDSARRRTWGQRFPVAVTFDDDLPSHVDHALPVLRRVGVHATFFLCGASLGEPHSFWWEDLQRAIDARRIDAAGLPHVSAADVRAALDRRPRAIHRVAVAVEQLEPSRRAEVASALRDAVGRASSETVLRSDDVRALADAGFEIGFHTRRHDLLTALAEPALEDAMRGGREALEAAAARPLVLIGYPHGKADSRIAEAARAAGFVYGFTTYHGLIDSGTDPYLIPRLVPAFSASRFTLQLARAVRGKRRISRSSPHAQVSE